MAPHSKTPKPRAPRGPANLDRFAPIREHFERALATPKGLRFEFTTPLDAKSFCMRCVTFKRMERHNNQYIYPPGDPLHSSSIYDDLIVSRIQKAVTIKTIEKPLKISEL